MPIATKCVPGVSVQGPNLNMLPVLSEVGQKMFLNHGVAVYRLDYRGRWLNEM